MPDITLCKPYSYLPKCKTCYRRTAKPDKQWQSYSDFWEECRDENYKNYIPQEDL